MVAIEGGVYKHRGLPEEQERGGQPRTQVWNMPLRPLRMEYDLMHGAWNMPWRFLQGWQRNPDMRYAMSHH